MLIYVTYIIGALNCKPSLELAFQILGHEIHIFNGKRMRQTRKQSHRLRISKSVLIMIVHVNRRSQIIVHCLIRYSRFHFRRIKRRERASVIHLRDRAYAKGLTRLRKI